MKRSHIIGIIIAVAVVPGIVYAISPYFTGSEINEDLPGNVILPDTSQDASTGDSMETVGSESGDDSDIMMDDSVLQDDAMMEDVTPDTEEEGSGMMTEEMDGDEMTKDTDDDSMDASFDNPSVGETAGAGEQVLENVLVADLILDESEMEEMDAASTQAGMEPVTYSGEFIGVDDGIHDARGIAKVLPLEDGSQILRLEEFRATNGPGLKVYLATDKSASDYVNLGALKANEGNQNYDIPDGTDLATYDHVLIWCEPFRVLFGSSVISIDG